MSESEASTRVRGVTVVKPIVVGNVAKHFGKKREEDGHTHQWTLYVKPFNNEDMSLYVKKVQFKLHESYANSTRVVTCPPYEVTETGWGEFEASIRIYFHDSNERSVTIYHLLKLFNGDPLVAQGKKDLVSEFYDELIFQDPSSLMYPLLTKVKPLTHKEYKHETDFQSKKAHTVEAILSAKEQVKNEIAEMRESLKEAKDCIQLFKDEITKATKQREAEQQSTASVT